MPRIKNEASAKMRAELNQLKKQLQTARANEKSNRTQGYEIGFMDGWEAKEELNVKKEKAIAKIQAKVIAQVEKEFAKKMKSKISNVKINTNRPSAVAESSTKNSKRRGRPPKATAAHHVNKMEDMKLKRRGRPPKVQKQEIAEMDTEHSLI